MLNYAKAEFRASYGLKSQLPAPSGPEVVFSGRSNVGKSSLINKLCMRKSLARLCRTIEDDVQVLPGHNDFSTMGRERAQNPYLQEFVNA